MTHAKPLTLTNARGEQRQAWIDRPATPPRAWALLLHCLHDEVAARLTAALARHGVASLRLDLAQPCPDADAPLGLDDLDAAADHLRQHHQPPALLIGHSLGGAALLASADRLPEAAALVTLNAPCSPAQLQRMRDPDAPARADRAPLRLGERSFCADPALLRAITAPEQQEKIRNLKKSLLIWHSPFDLFVDIDEAACLFQAARHPKSFLTLDRADHLLSDPDDARYVAEATAAWASRYLPRAEDLLASRPIGLEHGVVYVAEDHASAFSQAVIAGTHPLRADEPAAVGGEDLGPAPYDLLLAALGACTNMTLRMYAQRKNLPVQHLAVSLQHAKKPAAALPEAHSTSGAIDLIEREIEIIGDLDDATRARMVEIADRCPVHRTLHNEVVIRSRLKP
jgi:uncharacterized OsmC-like protein/alpha-beta hydrolase superfamily lysophospholipase